MAESGIPKLTFEQVAKLCEEAERAARKYILSNVSLSRIIDLQITVDAKGTKPIDINIDVNVILSPLMKGFDVNTLVREATKQAFGNIEDYLWDLKCKSNEF